MKKVNDIKLAVNCVIGVSMHGNTHTQQNTCAKKDIIVFGIVHRVSKTVRYLQNNSKLYGTD